MQRHGSTCDCTFSVLLRIALCICFAFFVCLHGGPPDFSGVPRLVWGTQVFHCLPSTVYPPLPALDSSETGARSSYFAFMLPAGCDSFLFQGGGLYNAELEPNTAMHEQTMP